MVNISFAANIRLIIIYKTLLFKMKIDIVIEVHSVVNFVRFGFPPKNNEQSNFIVFSLNTRKLRTLFLKMFYSSNFSFIFSVSGKTSEKN